MEVYLHCWVRQLQLWRVSAAPSASVLRVRPQQVCWPKIRKIRKTLILQAIPGTQGIYGLLMAFLIFIRIGLLGGGMIDLTVSQGLYILASGIPIGAVGIWSGIAQGKAAAAGIMLLGKRSDQLAKGIIYAAMVETYAIFALLISILMLFNLGI